MKQRLQRLARRLREWADDPTITPLMTRSFVIVVVGAAIVVPLAIIALPYVEFFNDMAVQPKVRPQMIWSQVGPERRPLPGDRDSVPGTIAREQFPYPFPGKEPEIAERAGRELSADNSLLPPPYRPPQPSLAMLERGQKHYESLCIACHGRYGFGDGQVARMGFPAPPSLLSRRVRDYPLGRIFHIPTEGQNVMPSYALQLPPEDRWAVVFYVRTLHEAFPNAAGSEPADAGTPDGAAAAGGAGAGGAAAAGGATPGERSVDGAAEEDGGDG